MTPARAATEKHPAAVQCGEIPACPVCPAITTTTASPSSRAVHRTACIRPAEVSLAGITPEPRRGNPYNINHAPAFSFYRGVVADEAGFSLCPAAASPPKRRRPFLKPQAGACRLTTGGGPARPAAGILIYHHEGTKGHEAMTKILSPEDRKQIINRLHVYLCLKNVGHSYKRTQLLVLNFEKYQGTQCLLAMNRFIDYAVKQPRVKSKDIAFTLVHDLTLCHTPCFRPRTANY